MGSNRLAKLLEYYQLDKYIGDFMTMGVYTLEEFSQITSEDINNLGLLPNDSDYEKILTLVINVKSRLKTNIGNENRDNQVQSKPETELSDTSQKSDSINTQSANTNKPIDCEDECNNISKKSLLGILALIIGFTFNILGYIEEGLYFDDMLIYFIGFIFFSVLGLYLIKENLFTNAKKLIWVALLVITAFCGYYYLCDSCYYGELDHFSIYAADDLSITLFVISSLLTIVYGIKISIKTKAKEDINETNLESNTDENISNNVCIEDDKKELTLQTNTGVNTSQTIYEEDDENKLESQISSNRIYWKTRHGKYGFKYCWFIAYLGLPISVIYYLISIGMLHDANSPDYLSICILGVNLILSSFAASGLFCYKKYSYRCLLASYIINLLFNAALTLIIISSYSDIPYMHSKVYMSSISMDCIIQIIISAIFMKYFINRKEYFNR